MSAGNERGITDALKFDVRVLHETWMDLIWPRQLGAADTVLGKYRPEETGELLLYRLWWALGVPIVAVLYPLLLCGYFVRAQTRRINVTADRLGLAGVVVLFTLLWGGLLAAVYFLFSGVFSTLEIVAIGAAGGVAVVSSALAYGFWRLAGRKTTVLLAYPFAMTALFLPPVVAGVFHPVLEDLVIARSDELARWLFQNGPDVVTDPLGQFDRKESHHIIIWFVFSFPVGWLLGSLVTLADLIRPKSE